jgi:hypothetical protein
MSNYVVRATLVMPEPRPRFVPTRHHHKKPDGFLERMDWLNSRIAFYTKLRDTRRRNPVRPEDAHKVKVADGTIEYELALAIAERDSLVRSTSLDSRRRTPARTTTPDQIASVHPKAHADATSTPVAV